MSDSNGTQKPGGLGSDGTIPPDEDGVAAGLSEEPSTFEPEEDPDAATPVEERHGRKHD